MHGACAIISAEVRTNMKQPYTYNNFTDKDGNPAGGVVEATGIQIKWQDGPLGRGNDRVEPNGAFVETLIDIVIQRLEFYNASKFRCRENSMAITKLQEANMWLNERTARREKAGVEGTHQEDPPSPES